MAYGQHYRSPFGDTTFTKVFVGGLAWETPVEEMRKYFEQFGHILEAVIITDKITGKSKGYGFVTYEDAESAKRACIEPNPVIDGRRANCNIASLGQPRSSPSRGGNQGGGAFQGSTFVHGASPSYSGAPPQLAPPSSVFYPPYGYAPYSPEYAYHQAMYNSVMQYPYYGPTSNAMSAPYYYGYSPATQVPTPRGAISPQAQRVHQPSYMYYPTQQTGPSDYPTPPPRLVFVPPRQPGLQTPQDTAKETDDATVSSRPPNT